MFSDLARYTIPLSAHSHSNVSCPPSFLTHLAEPSSVETNKGVDEKTKKELMIRKVYRMAMNGSLGAVNYLSDRAEGKAKETKEITHKDTLIIE